MAEQIWEINWTILNTTSYATKKKQNTMAGPLSCWNGARTRPCLHHPDKKLSIRRGVQGWGRHRWHSCVRSQAHPLPLTGCQLQIFPLTQNQITLSQNHLLQETPKASTPCPMLSLLWAAASVRCSEKAPAPLGSVPGLASDLLDALGKAN